MYLYDEDKKCRPKYSFSVNDSAVYRTYVRYSGPRQFDFEDNSAVKDEDFFLGFTYFSHDNLEDIQDIIL